MNYLSGTSQEEGIVLQLADGRIQAYNAAAERILGQSVLASPWQLIDETGFPFSSETHPAMIAFRTGKPCVNVVGGIYKPNGELVWLVINSQPLQTPGGTTPETVITSFTDITKTKCQQVNQRYNSAEDEEAWEVALRQSPYLIQQIADTIPGTLYLYDLVGQENFYVNHKIAQLWGYTPEQIKAMGIELFNQLMHPDDLVRLPSHFEQFKRSGSGEVLTLEYRIQHANGEWRWFCSYETVFRRTADGLPQQILGIVFDITERRGTEVALRQSNERFELAAAAVNCLIYDWNVHDNTVERTQGLTEVCGYTLAESEPTYQWWQERVHPDDLQKLEDQFMASMVAGNRYSVEYRVLHKDGRYVWVEDRGFAVRDGDGRIVRVVGSSHDISERQAALHDRKQAEADLRESEERIRLATTAAELGMWFWNLTTDELVFTQKCKDLFGLDPDTEISYEFFLSCLHPEDRQLTYEAAMHAIQEKAEYNIEYRNIWPDGSIHWIAARGRIFDDAEGKLVKMMGTTQDITQRKRAEEDLRQREMQLRCLVDANIIGIIFATPDQITEANDAFLDMVGYTREELVAGEIYRQQITPPEYAGLDQRGLEDLLSFGVCTPYEKEYIRKDGSLIPILIGGALVQREPISWVCFILDLTQMKQLEKTLRQQAEELQQANRLKDEFLAILSHELRSPLNPILGWSTLLKTRKFDEAATIRGLETIERNAKLQIQLIDDLLDVSRIIRGKLSLIFTPVNLVSVIDAAWETVQLTAEAKSIQIHKQLDSNVGQVVGDFYRLQQVVGNLLSNAIKFAFSDSCIEVGLSVVSEEDSLPSYAQITVTDAGIGISPEFLPYVFESFRQADSSTTRKFGGLGLGLSIVRHLVELHNGTVAVNSLGEGQGATFTVRLPLMRKEEIEEEKGLGAESEQFNSSLLGGVRLLIVDDEADTLEFVSLLLEPYGAIAILATSATEALGALAQSQPDILISDLAMPKMDGYSLIRLIRAMPPEKGGEIPAIALTAYTGESIQQQVLAAGFQKHIAKPVEATKLLTSIVDLLKH
ncbi:PAS domain S-box [Cylindrospermum stagnale PCC 7417]|uniref:Circadian input-output histidine kinase CikA n=1 Tax=Cylindrospermum stagnale PCC 7417 TaxID=56107 RepID=K9WWG7_9NOST|nr:PAS domain-containing protein [Cylindrospermum stagnale]AFZ24121.1 PAS domain S-box [Cylindrospermum stagnale PCC 7417]